MGLFSRKKKPEDVNPLLETSSGDLAVPPPPTMKSVPAPSQEPPLQEIPSAFSAASAKPSPVSSLATKQEVDGEEQSDASSEDSFFSDAPSHDHSDLLPGATEKKSTLQAPPPSRNFGQLQDEEGELMTPTVVGAKGSSDEESIIGQEVLPDTAMQDAEKDFVLQDATDEPSMFGRRSTDTTPESDDVSLVSPSLPKKEVVPEKESEEMPEFDDDLTKDIADLNLDEGIDLPIQVRPEDEVKPEPVKEADDLSVLPDFGQDVAPSEELPAFVPPTLIAKNDLPIAEQSLVQDDEGVFVEKWEYHDFLHDVDNVKQHVSKQFRRIDGYILKYSKLNNAMQSWYDKMNEVQEKLLAIDSRLFERG
ncbi:MAG: hypothetical protein H6502_01145 [Candidatus Woesearchaeota archaeon]|nr:MAG: hypothetical protein H6502_01145 [Candidatus Woesearchaeota archaeon]